MARVTRCAVCGSEVLWTVTEAGKRLAVDPRPDEAGNTTAYRDGLGVWRSRRPSPELPIAPWERLYMPHAATCRTAKTAEAVTVPPVLPPGVADLAAHRRARGRRP